MTTTTHPETLIGIHSLADVLAFVAAQTAPICTDDHAPISFTATVAAPVMILGQSSETPTVRPEGN